MSEFLNPQEITALSRAMLRSRWDEARDKAALKAEKLRAVR